MTTYNWITAEDALEIHHIQIEAFGGLPGIRYPGGLMSALARPQQLHSYGSPTTVELAAAYAAGISKNHPFIDGNKRTAHVVASTFMSDNGWSVLAPTAEIVRTFLALADGTLSEDDLVQWYIRHSYPLP